jgi:hypothetical protein
MYLLSETANTGFGSYGALTKRRRNVPIVNVDYSTYATSIHDDYAKPYHSLIWGMDWGGYTTSSLDDGVFAPSTKTYTETGTGTNMEGYSPDKVQIGDKNVIINTARVRHLILGKDQKIESYSCHYLKKPKDIVVDVLYPALQQHSELAEFLHDEIVDYAVKLASAAIVPEQGKYSVNQLESKEDE